MKAPSPLGASIEAAIDGDPRFHRHREPVQYLCCYRTSRDLIFAIERVTISHINFWLPELDEVRNLAEGAHMPIRRSDPTAHPKRYGRISSLNAVPELAGAVLYRVQVNSVSQAMAVAGTLA